MTGEETSFLLDEVCSFLQSCGGPYEVITPEIQVNLIYSIVSDQYVIRYNSNEIEFFASYWKIYEQDIPTIKALQRPQDIYTGPVVYIVEAGNTGKIASMVQAIHDKNTAAQIAMWHRNGTLKRFTLIKKGVTQ